MMSDKRLQERVRKDVEQVKKDVGILMRDSAARIRVSSGKVPKEFRAWVQANLSQVNKDLEKLTYGTRKTIVGAASTMKKDFGQQIRKTNASPQKIVGKAAGSLGKKVSRYPWVAISTMLAVGLILVSISRTSRQLRV